MAISTEQISKGSASPTGTESTPTVPDWSFVRRPFWLLSHLFAVAMVSLFTVLGLWQLDRLDQRRAQNDVVSSRTSAQPLFVDAGLSGEGLEFTPAIVTGRVVDADAARIANRSQGGVAGEHVVAIVELSDGSLLAVNRGFVPVNADVPLGELPDGVVELSGWLRDSVKAEGWFAVADTGEGRLLPRLDTEALALRVESPVAPVWLQLGRPDVDDAAARFPDPVPLPELGEGPHLSYAGQWFIFAVLGVAFYVATLRRRAHRRPEDEPMVEVGA